MKKERGSGLFYTPDRYAVALQPYLQCIHNMPPSAATSFVRHDFANFATLVMPHIDTTSLRGLNMTSIDSTRMGLATAKPLLPSEGGELAQALPAYLLSLIASHDYLRSLHEDDSTEQMNALHFLHALRSPLRPIVSFKVSDVVVTNSNRRDIELNGLEFVLVYNLLDNARRYGSRINGSRIKSVMQFNAASHDMHILNFSNERPPEDPLSQFSHDHFGLFIASMYACLLGKTLSTSSYPLRQGKGGKDKYLVDVVVK